MVWEGKPGEGYALSQSYSEMFRKGRKSYASKQMKINNLSWNMLRCNPSCNEDGIFGMVQINRLHLAPIAGFVPGLHFVLSHNIRGLEPL